MDRSNFNPKVGDVVRIRSWEDMEAEFGVDEDGNIPCKYSFTDFMRNMFGDEFMITGIEGQRLLGYTMGAISISIDMVEPVPEDDIDGAELDDFLTFEIPCAYDKPDLNGTRSSLLDVLYKNFIHTARAKGLKEMKVVLVYGLKNAAPIILTAVGQSFGSLITGTIVTETLFNIPGLGMLTMTSINRRDVFVIQGVVLFVTMLYVLVNLVVDVLYGFVDPRLQPGRK